MSSPSSLPDRRNLVRGVAWSLPAAAVAAAAPSFAASPRLCPTVPNGALWTLATASGTGGAGTASWSAVFGRWDQYQDNGSSATAFVRTFTTTIALEAGVEYCFSSLVRFHSYGNGNPVGSTPLSLSFRMDNSVRWSVTTRTAPIAVPGTTATLTGCFTASVSKQTTFQFQTLIAAGNRAGDDIGFTPPTFTSCSA